MTDTPQWNDEPMDERLRDLAREYNRPSGMVPREAMWQAIAPTIRAARTPGSAPDIAPSITRKRRHIAPYAWSTALAAGLVLGIVLEREVLAPHALPSSTTTPRTADSQQVAATPPISTSGATVVATPSSPATRVASVNPQQPTRRAQTSGAAIEAASTTRINGSDDLNDSGTRNAKGNAADAQQVYRLAARQTLVQAEALLTAYRASDDQQRDKESMQQAGRWARDVLTSTRLLLDSPAGEDPQMHALFTDLELVLAQIVQLSGAPLQAGERDLIERAMRDRDLLPRLRSAVPAGATAD